MNALVLDIETRPDAFLMDNVEFWQRKALDIEPDGRLKDPLKIEEDKAKKLQQKRDQAALSPFAGLIACIGVQHWSEDKPTVFCVEEATRYGEQGMLQEFDLWLSKWPRDFVVVGFNIRDFDMPFLLARLAVHGMACPRLPMPRNYRRCIDLCDVFTSFSLSDWRIAALGRKPKEVDGADLLHIPLEDLAKHCSEDVVDEMELAQRTSFAWAEGGR